MKGGGGGRPCCTLIEDVVKKKIGTEEEKFFHLEITEIYIHDDAQFLQKKKGKKG